jgi:hypothetical protein
MKDATRARLTGSLENSRLKNARMAMVTPLRKDSSWIGKVTKVCFGKVYLYSSHARDPAGSHWCCARTEPSDLNTQDTAFVFHIDFDWIKVQLAAQRRVGNIYGLNSSAKNDPA